MYSNLEKLWWVMRGEYGLEKSDLPPLPFTEKELADADKQVSTWTMGFLTVMLEGYMPRDKTVRAIVEAMWEELNNGL